jgi:integrase/recombinase XerD
MKKGWNPERDVAILSMLLNCGIRASELTGLKIEDVHFEGERGSWIKVFGKGRKERIVPLGNKTALTLRRYLRERPETEEPYVFLSTHKHRLSLRGLESIFRRFGSDLQSVRCSPHTCRHSYSMAHVAEGTNPYVLSKTLGHSSISITEHYLRGISSEEIRRQASRDSALERMTR